MGIGDDTRLLGLAEDPGEADAGHRAAVREQIAQHLARADARQLVDVPHQQQMRARSHRLDQLVGQQQIQH